MESNQTAVPHRGPPLLIVVLTPWLTQGCLVLCLFDNHTGCSFLRLSAITLYYVNSCLRECCSATHQGCHSLDRQLQNTGLSSPAKTLVPFKCSMLLCLCVAVRFEHDKAGIWCPAPPESTLTPTHPHKGTRMNVKIWIWCKKVNHKINTMTKNK